MMMMGVGNGIFGSPNTASVMSVVERQRFGVVSALVNMVRTSGNLTGISVGTTLVVLMMASKGFMPDLSALTNSAGGVDFDGLSMAFTAGMRRAFILGVFLVAVGGVITLWTPHRLENIVIKE